MKKSLDLQTIQEYYSKLLEIPSFIRELSEYESDEVLKYAEARRFDRVKLWCEIMDADPLSQHLRIESVNASRQGIPGEKFLDYLLSKDLEYRKASAVVKIITDYNREIVKSHDVTLETEGIHLRTDKLPSVITRMVCIIELSRQGKEEYAILKRNVKIDRDKVLTVAEKLFPGGNPISVYNEIMRWFPRIGIFEYREAYPLSKLEKIEEGIRLSKELTLT